MLEFYTLGGFALDHDGARVSRTAWGTHRAATLCKVLLTYSGQWLHKEQVMDWVWPEASMEASARYLRIALSELRRALEPTRKPRDPSRYIEHNGDTLRLNRAGTWCDSWVLSQAVDVAPTDAEAIPRLQAAVALYRGVYLPDELYADWSQAERQRLALAYETVRLKWAQALAAQRRPGEAIQVCRQALVDQPSHEEFTELLMHCAVRLHQPGLALEAYTQLKHALKHDLQLQPSPKLVQLAQQIQTGTLDSAIEGLVDTGAVELGGTVPTRGQPLLEAQRVEATLDRSTRLLADLRVALARMQTNRQHLAATAQEAQTVQARVRTKIATRPF